MLTDVFTATNLLKERIRSFECFLAAGCGVFSSSFTRHPINGPTLRKPSPGLYRNASRLLTYELSAVTSKTMRIRQWATTTAQPPPAGGNFYNSGTAALKSDGTTWRGLSTDATGYCCGNNAEIEFQFMSTARFKLIRSRIWRQGCTIGPDEAWQTAPPDEYRLVGGQQGARSAPVTGTPKPKPKPKNGTNVPSEIKIPRVGTIKLHGAKPTPAPTPTPSAGGQTTGTEIGPSGTISLKGSDGTVYGPHSASGIPGRGGMPNAGWEARPNVIIPAVAYRIVDSSPSTWAQNGDSGGRGQAIVMGYSTGGIPATIPPVVKTPTEPTSPPVNTQGGSLITIIENRSSLPTQIFAEGGGPATWSGGCPGRSGTVRPELLVSRQISFSFGYLTNSLGTGTSPAAPNCWMMVPEVEPWANHVELDGRKTAASVLPSPS